MAPKKTTRQLSEAEFQQVFQEVRADINTLQLHDDVFGGVLENLTRYPQLNINYVGFFTPFFTAMRTDLVIRLGRVFDPEGTGHTSCTLARCLCVMRDSPHFFTEAAISARLNEDYRKANPDCLPRHRPDAGQLAADLKSIETTSGRLIRLRHKVHAHKDLDTVLTGKRDEFLSTHEEVRDLIQLAHAIWNRWSFVWNASTYSDKTIRGDDYKHLFEALRRGMKLKSFVQNRQSERWRKRVSMPPNEGGF